MNISSILENTTVIEFAGVLAGPSVGMFLAELGATVIKIEHPGTAGDVTRSWRLKTEQNDDSRSSYFNSVNWGKTTRVLNLKNPQDYEQASRLISEADIILVSTKPGDDEKLGLSYEKLKALNPGMIYASITGFGPENQRTAYDAVVQAESGFMYLNREPGGEPLKMPVALIDVLAAHHLKELILAAVIHRLKTGNGCKVEVSLFEAAVTSLVNQAGAWLYASSDPEPMGTEHPHIYPYGCSFRTADDRSILLAVGNDAQFQALCELLGRTELAENPAFATNPARSANRTTLREQLRLAFAEINTADAFLDKLQERRIPAGLVRRVSEAVEEYSQRFALHQDEEMTGLPQLAGRMNGARISRPLTAPPVFPEEEAITLQKKSKI